MTEAVFFLDRKTKAIRSGQRWNIQRLQPDGSWDMVAAWEGSRRSLLKWCEDNAVTPSRDAEQQLGQMSEGTGFRERT